MRPDDIQVKLLVLSPAALSKTFSLSASKRYPIVHPSLLPCPVRNTRNIIGDILDRILAVLVPIDQETRLNSTPSSTRYMHYQIKSLTTPHGLHLRYMRHTLEVQSLPAMKIYFQTRLVHVTDIVLVVLSAVKLSLELGEMNHGEMNHNRNLNRCFLLLGEHRSLPS